MATALASAWTKAGLLDVSRSLAADPFPDARAKFRAATGVTAGESNRAVLGACDVLVLAVKPQVMSAVLAELKPLAGASHLFVSIAAGVTLNALARGLGESIASSA